MRIADKKLLYDPEKQDKNICLCPSELISNHIGLVIHKNYDLNRFESNDEFQKYLHKSYRKSKTKFDELVSYYVSKYPKLQSSSHDDWNMLFGVVSKFNEQDINFFCNEWLTTNRICFNGQTLYNKISNIFQNYFGINFCYVMSPFTMNYINDNFNIIDKEELNYLFKKLYENC